MAALCTGNYGLSQNCLDNSKEFYFVKLTDSALRAVEQYQRNQEKYNASPTIRIEGNSGVISFPMPGQQWQQFRFSIDEIEGSFQCIKQSQNHLEVEGSLPFKLRIHANEDVYETTKYRMAVAEENQKNKCTREIKPNQTDIGRKVKIKNRHSNILSKRDSIKRSSSLSLPPSLGTTTCLSENSPSVPSSGTVNLNATGTIHQQHCTNDTALSPLMSSGTLNYSESSVSPLHSSSLKSSNSNNYSSNTLVIKSHAKCGSVTSAASLSSALSSAAGSGTSGITSSYYMGNNGKGSSGIVMTTSLSSGIRKNPANVNLNQKNLKNGCRHLPDISKKKLRDRLIHLLALKPYKKPELFNRLQNEGIREREKASICVILKEISTMRDNTYNLKRQMWNDVNEDWPFYNQQDLQMLKRRKPQNLTPPISSDGGSSTSGQSPTSTHNGSPPPPVKRPSLDRDRYYDEPSSKKQRISHFKKDGSETTCNIGRNQEPEDSVVSLSYGVLGCNTKRKISEREDNLNLTGHSMTGATNYHNKVFANSQYINSQINNNISPNNNNKINNSRTTQGNNDNIHRKLSPLCLGSSICNSKDEKDGTANSGLNIDDITNTSSKVVNHRGLSSCLEVQTIMPFSDQSSMEHKSDHINDRNKSDKSYCQSNIKMSSVNSTTYNEGPHLSSPSQNYDFSHFTSITSVEQRRIYKAEFERNYAEYRELLKIVESVAKKFKALALQLEENRNNASVYREIRCKILSEYDKTNRDKEHQKIKARFDYLHSKLAHIKALVHDFDQTLTSNNAPGNNAVTHSPLQQSSDSLGNEHFGNLSPCLVKLTAGNLSSNRTRSSPIMSSSGNLDGSSSAFDSYQSY